MKFRIIVVSTILATALTLGVATGCEEKPDTAVAAGPVAVAVT